MNFTLRRRLAALVLPVLVVATSACDIAMAEHKEKETAEWRKTYELQPGGRVEIGNVNGKIDVRPGQGNTVEVLAEKIAHGATREAARDGLARIEIKEESTPSLVKIDTNFIKSASGMFGAGNNLQVQYTVRVPAGVQLHIATVNGGLEITGVRGKVHAEATNGGIRARDITGPIDASTTNGGVDVDLSKVTDNLKLETVNGGIKLSLPSDARASVLAQIVNGGIDVNGLTIDTQTSSKRKLEGKMNGGGRNIDLQGVIGGIKISAR